MLRLLSSIAAISAIVGGGTARAQDADAETLFDDGNRMMAAGKLPEACAAFEASNRVEPRAGTLIRLGQCREQTKQLASAWSAYRDALARAKDAQKKTFATERIAALKPHLSSLTVHVADAAGLELTRNGEPFDAALWNRATPVDGGTYALAAHSPGHRPWSASITVPVADGAITVTVPALAPDVVATVAPVTPTPMPTRTPAPIPEPSRWTNLRYAAIGTAALAVVAGATGGVVGELARRDQSSAEALCTPNVPCVDGAHAQSLIDRGRDRALIANVGFGVAGAAAIATVVLWLVGAPTASGEHALAIVPDGHGIALGGRF
ncbi:MAG TPA: hypothetical protein VGG28_03680 [Kofleriaceae bacterium]|jgi:hypothetical protein